MTPGEADTLQWLQPDEAASQAYGVPVSLLIGQQYLESRGNPNAKNVGTVTLPGGQVVHTDAVGLAQFEPAAWATYGGGASRTNPEASITAEAKYLAALHQQTGSWTGALNAYAGGAYPNYASEVEAEGQKLTGLSAGSAPASATQGTPTGFWSWLHRYAWVLILPGALLLWLGIKTVIGTD